MAFYGFPVAMMVGGAIYNNVGPKTLLWIAFGSHLLGLILTMTAGGFVGLLVSTFLIGFANGSVEAACNPLIADMYPDKQGEMLNKFHVWFPGGIVIGSLIAFAIQDDVSWQVLIGTMLIPTAIYGILMLGQNFPKSINLSNDTGKNFASIFTPLFLVIALLMTMTATTEFGATQWVERILGNAGGQPHGTSSDDGRYHGDWAILRRATDTDARYYGGACRKCHPGVHRVVPTFQRDGRHGLRSHRHLCP